jgi:hypothetical protein
MKPNPPVEQSEDDWPLPFQVQQNLFRAREAVWSALSVGLTVDQMLDDTSAAIRHLRVSQKKLRLMKKTQKGLPNEHD